MLKVAVKGHEAHRRFGGGRELGREIEGPFLFRLTEYELTTLVCGGEHDDQGPKHDLSPWRILVCLEEIALAYEYRFRLG